MSSYHPIHDVWFLTRAKLKGGRKYYGAYLGGFPERARTLLGIKLNDPLFHVCGGMARLYPYRRGFGPNDRTLDLDPVTKPDFLADAREPLPLFPGWMPGEGNSPKPDFWPAVLMDPPYSEADAEHYWPGKSKYPSPNLLVKNALDVVAPHGRVGIIHYLIPKPPEGTILVAVVGVVCGFNNRMRAFSVFEKGPAMPSDRRQKHKPERSGKISV